MLARTAVAACGVSDTSELHDSSYSQNMHIDLCHFGESSKLEFESDLQIPPTRDTLEDHSSAASTNGSVPSWFKTWKRQCGAQWDNLRLQATRVG